MRLTELAAAASGARLVGDGEVEVRELAYHSAAVTPGSLYFCIVGERVDGHDFAEQAAAAGAVALVAEHDTVAAVPHVIVASTRRAMAAMAACWYGRPSKQLLVSGVTGTNGKTTTSHLLAGIAAAAGLPSALLGTVVNRIGGRDNEVRLTTAESLDLQRMFAEMVAAGDRACALEVSSHALALERAFGIDFDAVIFTNLTRDHLDFHRDLDDYFAAKRRLFLPQERRNGHAAAIVNVGDAYGRRLYEECAPYYGDDLWSYAVAGDDLGGGGAPITPDVVADKLVLRADGSSFVIAGPRCAPALAVELPIAARFNVENALAAATAALALGLPPAAIVSALGVTAGVPGRFEAVSAGQDFDVIVDYSHTPDSLENALLAARALCRGRLFVVFGCGGDRDRGKRPLMGALGARLADRAIVTSDNPRGEDPEAIISEIVAGVDRADRAKVVVEPDRRAAMQLAFAEARGDDLVVVAGKGHEQGQTIAGEKIPFDDRVVARELIAAYLKRCSC